MVLNGNWMPVCVIRTTELETKPFGEVDEAFAYDYGEGDRTLQWWREHVFAWYARQCQVHGHGALVRDAAAVRAIRGGVRAREHGEDLSW